MTSPRRSSLFPPSSGQTPVVDVEKSNHAAMAKVWQGASSLAKTQFWFLVTVVLALTIIGLLVAWITAIIALVFAFKASKELSEGCEMMSLWHQRAELG